MQALVHELVDRAKEVQLFEERQFSDTVRTLLFDAAEFGNAEFIIILIRSHPDIIWTTDNLHQSLFHIAVKNRQESVFNLIYEIGPMKEVILTYVNFYKQNILHLAGELAPSSRLNLVAGAALQMQRELLWFKVSVCIISTENIVLHLLYTVHFMYKMSLVLCAIYIFTFKTCG